jgi:hypothetical protein
VVQAALEDMFDAKCIVQQDSTIQFFGEVVCTLVAVSCLEND